MDWIRMIFVFFGWIIDFIVLVVLKFDIFSEKDIRIYMIIIFILLIIFVITVWLAEVEKCKEEWSNTNKVKLISRLTWVIISVILIKSSISGIEKLNILKSEERNVHGIINFVSAYINGELKDEELKNENERIRSEIKEKVLKGKEIEEEIENEKIEKELSRQGNILIVRFLYILLANIYITFILVLFFFSILKVTFKILLITIKLNKHTNSKKSKRTCSNGEWVSLNEIIWNNSKIKFLWNLSSVKMDYIIFSGIMVIVLIVEVVVLNVQNISTINVMNAIWFTVNILIIGALTIILRIINSEQSNIIMGKEIEELSSKIQKKEEYYINYLINNLEYQRERELLIDELFFNKYPITVAVVFITLAAFLFGDGVIKDFRLMGMDKTLNDILSLIFTSVAIASFYFVVKLFVSLSYEVRVCETKILALKYIKDRL